MNLLSLSARDVRANPAQILLATSLSAIAVAGRLELMSDDSEGIFFKLKDASQAN
jgi:hypothetical protein